MMKYALPTTLALLSLVSLSASANDALWDRNNCDEGNVTDALCCKDNHCSDLQSKRGCEIEKTCLWSSTDKVCKSNRDAENNVCCRSPSSNEDWCDAVSKGECPAHFEVPAGCCADKQLKWSGILETKNRNHVCCNTPCTEVSKMGGCALPSHCREKPRQSVQGRSFGSPHNQYGYDPSYYGFAHLPRGRPFSYGKQYFTGLEYAHGGYGSGRRRQDGDEDEKEKEEDQYKVEEITVDDVIEALTLALTNDKDVFESSYQYDADPLFGKTRTGGTLGDFNFLDPQYFIKQIYNGNDRRGYRSPGYGYPSNFRNSVYGRHGGHGGVGGYGHVDYYGRGGRGQGSQYQ